MPKPLQLVIAARVVRRLRRSRTDAAGQASAPRGPSHLPALSLAATLAATGALHLAKPGPYDRLIPKALGRPRPWTIGSGVAELVCAASLVHPATRRIGSLATAGLVVTVFPGNITAALKARRSRIRSGAERPGAREIVAWARLPFQLPLLAWALAAGRSAGPRES